MTGIFFLISKFYFSIIIYIEIYVLFSILFKISFVNIFFSYILMSNGNMYVSVCIYINISMNVGLYVKIFE